MGQLKHFPPPAGRTSPSNVTSLWCQYIDGGFSLWRTQLIEPVPACWTTSRLSGSYPSNTLSQIPLPNQQYGIAQVRIVLIPRWARGRTLTCWWKRDAEAGDYVQQWLISPKLETGLNCKSSKYQDSRRCWSRAWESKWWLQGEDEQDACCLHRHKCFQLDERPEIYMRKGVLPSDIHRAICCISIYLAQVYFAYAFNRKIVFQIIRFRSFIMRPAHWTCHQPVRNQIGHQNFKTLPIAVVPITQH